MKEIVGRVLFILLLSTLLFNVSNAQGKFKEKFFLDGKEVSLKEGINLKKFLKGKYKSLEITSSSTETNLDGKIEFIIAMGRSAVYSANISQETDLAPIIAEAKEALEGDGESKRLIIAFADKQIYNIPFIE